jgi:hypothetical protein
MKYFISLLILLSPLAKAQECPMISKEMAQYFSQKNWKPYEVKNSALQGISGYMDESGGFHFESMSRSGKYPVQVTMETENEDFLKDCENFDSKGRYLRLKRINHENNSFLLKVRFLPALQGFTNTPLKDQDLKRVDFAVSLDFSKDSLVTQYDFRPEALQTEVRRKISDQISRSPKFGEYQIDLSGMDDLVCDLIQGKAALSIRSSFISKAPLVTQTQNYNPQDVQTVYQGLHREFPQVQGKEKTLYTAGRLVAELEQQRRVQTLKSSEAFPVVKKLMNQEMDQLLDLDADQLSCLIDQMQSYKQDKTLRHYFTVNFAFPSLGDLRAQGQKE